MAEVRLSDAHLALQRGGGQPDLVTADGLAAARPLLDLPLLDPVSVLDRALRIVLNQRPDGLAGVIGAQQARRRLRDLVHFHGWFPSPARGDPPTRRSRMACGSLTRPQNLMSVATAGWPT
jgi:hypothetical protein